MKFAGLACVFLAAVVAIVVVTSQHHQRSVQAVCHVWDTQGLKLHNQFASTGNQSNLFGDLGTLMAAPTETASLMSNMAAVAPSYMAPDFSELAKALHQSSQTSLLGALTSALSVGAETAAPTQAINNFLKQHCGIPQAGGG